MVPAVHTSLIRKRIGVLLGGNSSERKISLLSGTAVHNALKQKGLDVVNVDIQNGFESVIEKANIDVAFIALHGHGGEDGVIQRVLERLKIPYTGSGVQASSNAFNKKRTKQILKKKNIPTPVSFLINKKNWLKKIANIQLPVFIKPIDNGSSIGVYLIESFDTLKSTLRSVFRLYDEYLIEECIIGREITIGILGNRALPIIELKPKNAFFDFNAKYTKGKTEYIIPAPLRKSDAARYRRLALATHRALGARDFSRVDIMLDYEGNPYVLELNSIPGFTATSLLPKAAHEAGLDFSTLCLSLLTIALKRGLYGKKKYSKNKIK
ncbi:MAG: D-alanine--D-alanine ligase [Candidatus Omnitrophica bacterium]|nr:D-alanine--D-alanine ligase [Candidatus Omnitrophota bacterium]